METESGDIKQQLGLGATGHGHPLRRWLLRATILTLLLGGVAWWLLGGDEKGTLQYRTQEAVRGTLTITVTATGTLEPLNQVEVGSELSGTITEVAVDFNDPVEVGQVLARLDTATLESHIVEGRASLQAAEAKVTEAQATVRETAAALARCRELARQQMCSQSDLDSAEAAHQRARAAVVSARAQVAIAEASLAVQQTNLEKATIRSPIDGVVLDRKVEPGQTVAASFQTPELFTLAEDLGRMELIVAVDEADIGLIAEGQEASFTVDAFTDRQFAATITQVRRAPQTIEGVVSYETVLGVNNDELQLLPGMTATAEIVTRQLDDALLIPNAALRYSPPVAPAARQQGGSLVGQLFRRPHRSGGGPAPVDSGATRQVWLLQDGEPVPLTITTGASDGLYTEVLASEGLEGRLVPGMALITESVQARD